MSTWQERLWAKASPANADGCWIWRGRIDRHGYGQFRGPAIDGRSGMSSAHRWAYIATRGSVADDLVVDHLCNLTLCVNPRHLEAVTNAENQRRKAARITHCKWGHEFTAENTRVNPRRGGRGCRACERERGEAKRLGIARELVST